MIYSHPVHQSFFFVYLLQREVSRVYAIVWLVMQPVLFGLIGAEIALESLTGEIVGKTEVNT